MRNYIIIFALLLANLSAHSQKDSTYKMRNSIYFELLGNAGLYSFNYEKAISNQQKNHFNLRIGASYLWWSAAKTPVFVIEPIYLRGTKNHFMEFSLGLTILNRESVLESKIDANKQVRLNILPRIGYRYQPDKKNWLFRIGLLPILFTENQLVVSKGLNSSFLPILAFSIGKQL